jgi:hypothetical protein
VSRSLPPDGAGEEEGATCNRDGCPGEMIVEVHHCHCGLGRAPCSGCMYALHCTTCGVYNGPDGDIHDWDD